MKLLITALAVFLAITSLFFLPFPGRDGARELLVLAGVEPYPGYVQMTYFGILLGLSLGVGLVAALVALRAMDVRPHAKALVAHRRWMWGGLAALVFYLLSLPVLFVLSAIPYGGGRVPDWTPWILVAGWILLGYGLYRTLFQELKAVRKPRA